MHTRIIYGKIGKLSWKTVMLWLRMNKLYLHDHRTKRQLALLDKFFAVGIKGSHVVIALFSTCLFEMSLNTIVNRLSFML